MRTFVARILARLGMIFWSWGLAVAGVPVRRRRAPLALVKSPTPEERFEASAERGKWN